MSIMLLIVWQHFAHDLSRFWSPPKEISTVSCTPALSSRKIHAVAHSTWPHPHCQANIPQVWWAKNHRRLDGFSGLVSADSVPGLPQADRLRVELWKNTPRIPTTQHLPWSDAKLWSILVLLSPYHKDVIQMDFTAFHHHTLQGYQLRHTKTNFTKKIDSNTHYQWGKETYPGSLKVMLARPVNTSPAARVAQHFAFAAAPSGVTNNVPSSRGYREANPSGNQYQQNKKNIWHMYISISINL